MKYRIVIIDQSTRKEIEVVDYYESLEEANRELEEIQQDLKRLTFNHKIVSETINLTGFKSFAISTCGEHLIYQVEVFDPIVAEIFEIFKPYNQN